MRPLKSWLGVVDNFFGRKVELNNIRAFKSTVVSGGAPPNTNNRCEFSCFLLREPDVEGTFLPTWKPKISS